MREIKLRYKDPKGVLFTIDVDDLPHISPEPYDTWEFCGQFTSLKDKNQREIYEGDILLIESHWSEDWKGSTFEVTFEGGSFYQNQMKSKL